MNITHQTDDEQTTLWNGEKGLQEGSHSEYKRVSVKNIRGSVKYQAFFIVMLQSNWK